MGGVEPRLRVFLSHAHQEAKLALTLKERIKRDFLGLISVYASTDRRDLHPGAEWIDFLKLQVSQADIHAVLCSSRSLQRPWVNIELGGALFRRDKPPVILPLCHSQMETGALDVPLEARQAITISDIAGLNALYEYLANRARCLLPPGELDDLAREVTAFETEYKVSTSRQDASEKLLVTGNGPTADVIKNPAVLCISSKQLEETAKEAFELIRKALPVNLHHEVVLTSEELTRQLGTKHFDIVHTALYICPYSGDLVFNDIDLQTRAPKSVPTDKMTAEVFANLLEVAQTSLLVVTTPEPFGFVGRLLPHTNIVFPSSFVDATTMAHWMGAFYELLASSFSLSEACKRASAQACPCMRLYPKLPANSYMLYPSDPVSAATSIASSLPQ